MSVLLINASPKGAGPTSNSAILAKAFVDGMREPCDLVCLAGEDLAALAQRTADYDTVLILMPLYIHAMPGLMMRFLEQIPEAGNHGRSLGFIIQAGFIETEQKKYIERYFRALVARLGYRYLGTVSKGEAAGIYMFPKMFRKVLVDFSELGRVFGETGAFDEDLQRKLGSPYRLSGGYLFLLRAVTRIGLNDIGWHRVQKQNGVYERRLDRPYL